MTDEQLQSIRDRIHAAWELPGGFDVLYGDAETVVTGDIYDLFDEVERLRAREAALLEIAAYIADYPWQLDRGTQLHLADEMATKARALLAEGEPQEPDQ